ncbi:hypothetical protein, partial [Geobacillus sp. B4113_201601]|uniref:hypothetical protein n=2 Tax=Geobacillus TaxID=129337 RepID=UPI001F33E842
AELTQDFHPRVEGKPLPMDLFRENAKLTRDFHPRVEGKSRCPWNFSVKMPHWRGFSSPGGGQNVAHGSFP